MTLIDLMQQANHIARTEGSTQPDGSFGPSRAWRRNSNSGTVATGVEPPVGVFSGNLNEKLSSNNR